MWKIRFQSTRFNSINKLKSFLKRRNMDREELASWAGEGSQVLAKIGGDTEGMELWDPPWKHVLALKSPCLPQFPATRTEEVWKALLAVFTPSSLLLALPLNLLFSGPVYSLRKTDTLKKIKTFKILDSKDIFSTFLFLGKRTVNLRYSHVWCLLEKGKLLSGKKKKGAEQKF